MMETTTVFDDVFVPWERVFLAGEHEFAGPLALAFVEHHRFTAISYKLPLVDALVGSALLMADLNGIAKAGHVRDKLVQLISYAETLRGLTHYAALRAEPRESRHRRARSALREHGEVPLRARLSRGGAARAGHRRRRAGDRTGRRGSRVAGDGRATTRFLRRPRGVSGEDRLKALSLVRNLVASEFGAYQEVLAVHAEGSLEAEKLMLFRSYDARPALDFVRRLAGLPPGESGHLVIGHRLSRHRLIHWAINDQVARRPNDQIRCSHRHLAGARFSVSSM